MCGRFHLDIISLGLIQIQYLRGLIETKEISMFYEP